MKDRKALARCIRERYKKGEGDGDMYPLVFWDKDSTFGRIKDGDVVVFACKRGEREKQLTEAFTSYNFDKFPVSKFEDLTFITLTQYDENFKNVKVVFSPENVKFPLAEVLDKKGLKHLHIAESEKYAHVTFFFNGGRWDPFPHEKDIFIPSPRVDDYTKTPRMSSDKVADAVISHLGEYEFIVVNFANGDVLGHIPNFDAQVECAKAVDENLQRVAKEALSKGYVVIVTADHGLLEVGLLQEDPPVYSLGHTKNPVPFILLFPDGEKPAIKDRGKLGDIAPTILKIMGIERPSVMTGDILIEDELSKKYDKVLLVILDGWGLGESNDKNPIYVANPPYWNRLLRENKIGKLCASSECVGLLPDHAGNSEAGHTNIGAGRVVVQDEVKLELAIKSGDFAKMPALLEGYKIAREKRRDFHIINMLSEGSSHGTFYYAVEISKKAKELGVENIFLHEIFNRHGVERYNADKLIELLADKTSSLQNVYIVTGMGRKWALDRDKNWDRTKVAYDALVFGEGIRCSSG